jgi:hypothetical protein
VAFFARIDAIRAELAQGWPLTTIYARYRAPLGITYSGFCKLVGRHAADARPTRQRVPFASSSVLRSGSVGTTGAGEPSPVEVSVRRGNPAVSSPTAVLEKGSTPDAGHQPARTFVHDPVERPGDYERLFGARKQ